jgi:NHL repeat
MTRRAVLTFAAVALGAGVFVSSAATATGPCSKKLCSEEIAAGCAGLKGMALSACSKAVLLNCNTTDCSCTDPTLPACGPTTTTTTTSSTTTTDTITTTTATTTTATTLGGTTTSSTTTSTLCSLLRDWGGFGDAPGQFDNLYGVAATAVGQRVYTVELTNRVQEFDADGVFVAQWGSTGTGDGEFQNPVDVGVGPGGDVYVVDQGNQRIQRFDGDGAFLGKWGMIGSAAGAFTNPNGIGIDADGNVYVADSGNDRVQKFDHSGTFLGMWTTSLGAPVAPVDVALDGTQYAYVTFVEGAYLARYQTDGTLVDVPVTSVPFRSPVAVDALGRVYFGNPVLRRWDPVSGSQDVVAWSGAATITGIATAPENVVYVSDYGNSRVVKLSCPP